MHLFQQLDKARNITITLIVTLSLLFALPMTSEAVSKDVKCARALVELKDALETVMLENQRKSKEIQAELSKVKKSAKKYSASGGDIDDIVQDSVISSKEKKMLKKMLKKLKSIESYYDNIRSDAEFMLNLKEVKNMGALKKAAQTKCGK